MKKYFLLLLLTSALYCQGQDNNIAMYELSGANMIGGNYNILIGNHAGMYLTTESYCVIISEDSIGANLHGSDYLFYVQYDCKFLKDKPELKSYLRSIETYGEKKLTSDKAQVKKAREKVYWDIRGLLDSYGLIWHFEETKSK